LLAGLAILVASAAPSAGYPRPGVTSLVSVSVTRVQGNGDSGAGTNAVGVYGSEVDINRSGRFVVFSSAASNLVPGDTNGVKDVFRRDNKTGKIARVSVQSSGSEGLEIAGSACPEGSRTPSINAGGRYVAFESCRALSQEIDVPVAIDSSIYVHDMKRGTTEMVSLTTEGTPILRSKDPSFDAGGRYVAFVGDQPVPADPVGSLTRAVTGSGSSQIFVRDLKTDTTRLASVNENGDIGDERSVGPAMSPDGHFVAFASRASNLGSDTVPCSGGVPSCQELYLHDLRSDANELISIGVDGLPANGMITDFSAGISADDRFVSFGANATNLVPNDTEGDPVKHGGVYVRDRKRSTTLKASVDSFGRVAEDSSQLTTSISADGRLVAFNAISISPGCGWIVVHDLSLGISTYDGQPNAGCGNGGVVPTSPRISANGRFEVFSSSSSDLVKGDSNKKTDVFVKDRGTYLGTGGFNGGAPTLHPAPSPGGICVQSLCIPPLGSVSRRDGIRDVAPALTEQGANLRGAALAYRPQYQDLFATIDLEHMPQVLPGASPIFYGLRFEHAGTSYEVRATSLSWGTFELFDCTSRAVCTKVADLRGGYGTTGERTVFSVPLSDIGLKAGGRLSQVEAFSAIGISQTGATKVLDTLRIK
jgi:Tol biopolymer transport system component